MRKLLIVAAAAALLVGAGPAAAQRYGHHYRGDNAVRIHAGIFEPDGQSEYWDAKFFDFTGNIDNFDDWTLGIDYVRRLGGPLSLVVGGTAYEGESHQAYRDYVDELDLPIRHRTTLTVATGTVGFMVDLAPGRAPIIPYLGAGGGFWAWELEESGEFIDFFVDPPEIFPATFQDEGVAFGWYWVVGVDVPVGNDFSIFAQGRWDDADDELSDDFEDLGTLDLSGRSFTAGFSWRF